MTLGEEVIVSKYRYTQEMNKKIIFTALFLGSIALQGFAVSASIASSHSAIARSVYTAKNDTKRVSYVQVSPDSSLADAVRKARELRRLDKADSVVIQMARGNYCLYESLVLRPEDSHLCFEGTPSEDGEGVGTVIHGAVEINGWRKQGKLWVTDVPDFNGRPLDFRQLWVNRSRADKARSVNDYEQMPRIRWVDKKKRVIWVPASAVKPLLTGAKDKQGNSIIRDDSKYAEMTLHQMWEVSYLRIKNIRLQGDSAAVSFHDPEAKVQFERPWPSPMYHSAHNSPFFISNALPLLDTPGEWYHDIRTHKLYYMPRQGETMPRTADGIMGNDNRQRVRADEPYIYVAAPAMETLVRFEGTKEKPVDAVSFKHVNFAFTTWMRPSYKGHVPLQAGMFIIEGYKLRPSIDRVNNHKLDNQDWLGRPHAAVELYYAHRAVFDGCSFKHLGGDGIDFIEGGKDGAVLNSKFEDISMNGLVGGSFSPAGLETHLPYCPLDNREVCSGLQVKNNEFANVTLEEWGTCAIALGYVNRTNVEHNYIHDVSYSAISMGWGWNRNFGVMHDNRIHANLIERYAAHMYDCAGIYTLGNQPNTVIFENVVRDILHPSYVHDPKHYFYLYTDEGSSNILLKDNWTSEDKFLKNAYGPNNIWKNNGPSVSQDIVKRAGLLQEGRAEYDVVLPTLPKE